MLKTAFSVARNTSMAGSFFLAVGIFAAPAAATLTFGGMASTAVLGAKTTFGGVVSAGTWASGHLATLTPTVA